MLKGLLFFYLADLVVGVDKFIGAVIFFGLIIAVFSLVFYFVTAEEYERENLTKTRNSAKKLGKYALIACLVFGVIQAILPTVQHQVLLANSSFCNYIRFHHEYKNADHL